ncbi:MAG: glycoside hydrolase family 31 protein [Bacteroidota bacterium]|nr:glycoside hydrolase family 31 protein [Bacteroidota bacterium]
MKYCIFSLLVFGFITASAQTYLGNYSNYSNDAESVTVNADTSTIRLMFYADDIVRVDFIPSPQTKMDSSHVIVQKPSQDIQFTVRELDSLLIVQTSGFQIQIKKYPVRISFFDSARNVLLSEPQSGGIAVHHQSRVIRFSMDKNSHFYGTGERGTAMDKRTQKFISYNTQVGGYSEPLGTMNLNVPFVATTNGYALYIDNTYRGEFDFGFSDSTVFTYSAAGGEISYYVIAAATIPDQLERYTWLTGRQPLPPRWIFGFTQSKNRYANEQETRSIVQTMREKEFPCDAIVLDLAWFKHMGDISWDETAWPNHETMITDFLSNGIKTIMITEPYIIDLSHNFAEADKNGFLAKDSTGRTQLLEKWWSCGGCNSALLDLTNPKAQAWWWNKHPSSFGKNVAGIWTDLGEPEKHPETMMHYLGSTKKIHNIFNLLWAKIIFDGFNQLKPNERVVNLTRSGFAGIQRYGVLPWSGDVARSFGGLSVQLPMLLNMGMSGIGYHNSDLGGYARNPTTPELYIRWMQFGVFSPITRAHGAGENVKGSPTEPWQFGEEAERINRYFLQLRYKLLPYIYTLAYQNYKTGIPLARPLFWLDESDLKLLNESSSYMWGDAFLVSPVVIAGQRTKDVYLPKGNWYNFWTDEIVEGGKSVNVSAPLDKMPLFVKAGSIIPMAPVMKYSDERELDTLTLHIYPDDANTSETSYTLYEDDGKTLEYQKENYSLTTFTTVLRKDKKENTYRLTSSPSIGTFKGKLIHRCYIFEIHSVIKKPTAMQYNNKPCIEQKTFIKFRNTANSFYYDSQAQKLFVQLSIHSESVSEILIPYITLNKTVK